jgi:hypothetical protein
MDEEQGPLGNEGQLIRDPAIRHGIGPLKRAYPFYCTPPPSSCSCLVGNEELGRMMNDRGSVT